MKPSVAGRVAPVLAVCGLRIEARIAAGHGVVAVAGGGDPDALAAAIGRALGNGVAAVVSFGVAGALAADLRPGDLVVADRVVATDGDHAVDPRWLAMLRRRFPRARVGACAGHDAIVADVDGKALLRRATAAVVVDMESHVAARIAHARGLPFAVIRAVTDAADRDLPPAARIAMRDDGRIDVVAVLRSLATAPGQLPALLGVARDTRKALGALARGRRLLGPRLGDPVDPDLDQLPLDVV